MNKRTSFHTIFLTGVCFPFNSEKKDGWYSSKRTFHSCYPRKEWSGFLWNHVLRMELIHCVFFTQWIPTRSLQFINGSSVLYLPLLDIAFTSLTQSIFTFWLWLHVQSISDHWISYHWAVLSHTRRLSLFFFTPPSSLLLFYFNSFRFELRLKKGPVFQEVFLSYSLLSLPRQIQQRIHDNDWDDRPTLA